MDIVEKNRILILIEGDHWEDIKNKIKDQVFYDIDTSEIDIELEYDVCREIFDRYQFFKRSDDENRYGIRFVGYVRLILNKRIVDCYVFPKYYRGRDNINCDDMRLIMKAIEKVHNIHDYKIDNAEYLESKRNSKKVSMSRYKLAKWLVDDYCSNGIYYIREKRVQRRANGYINWNKTVSSLKPYIDGDDVIYDREYRNYTYKNASTLISDIHRAVVAEALSYLRAFREYMGVDIPDYDNRLSGRLHNYTDMIRKYQRIAFYVRDISLMNALDAWCSGESRFYELPVGTVSFELVWENCIRNVFGNISKGYTFGSPEYRLGVDENGNERKQQVDNDSIPDVINIFKDGTQARFLLLDAKYYLGRISKQAGYHRVSLKKDYEWIEGFPGYKDIAKQYDYYSTLKNRFKIQDGVNAFVMPWYDTEGLGKLKDIPDDISVEWCRYIGYAYKGDVDRENDEVYLKLKEVLGEETAEKMYNDESSAPEKYISVIQIKPDWLYNQVVNISQDKSVFVNKLWKLLKAESAGL